MYKVVLTVLAVAACLALVSAPATAGAIISSNSGLSSPAATLTFSEIVLPDNTPLTNQYASLGVTFFGGFYYNSCPGCVTAPPSGAKPDITDFPGSDTAGGSTLTTISLATPSDGIAFNFASELIPLTFTAFLGGTQVGQFSVSIDTPSINGTSGWGWYGFDNLTLDALQISTTVSGGPINGYEIDNLEYGKAASGIPEPSTFALLGAGVLALVVRRRLYR